MEGRRVAITTTDNPYCPFTEFDQWYRFDVEAHHHTCQLLARIAKTSDQLTDEGNDAEIERAIDEILAYDVRGIYRKVSPSSKIVPISLSA